MNFLKQELDELQKKYGAPIYIFDETMFEENYRNFTNCFQRIYPKYQLTYSYKTNYAPYICRLVKKLGGFAEVVSDMELQIAQMVGYPASKIVYNGPSKGELSVEHLLNGGILNVDNFEELFSICEIARQRASQIIKIGLRVNIDIDQNFVSRFGIDESEVGKAFAIVEHIPNLFIVGLHCHIGRSRSLKHWVMRAKKMIELVDEHFNTIPEYISLGSGMYGEMDSRLAEQFGDDLPNYQQYAQAAASLFAKHYPEDQGPVLMTEPGTTLINRYIYFIATVESIKHIKGCTFVVVNGSKHNLGEICELKRLPIDIISSGNTSEKLTDAQLVGYTCLEHDILYKKYSGDLAVGDYIVFGNVGGYSNVSKPPFIRPNVAIVTRTGKCIKRRETTKEILETYE